MPNIGKKVPVVLVHGLLGKGSDWDSFKDYLHGQNPGILAEAFDYSAYNTQWVTNPNIGAALADRIACMAAASRQQGGQGKVIAIAHSMGGLAIREAIAERPAILQDLGMAVTIATPNVGSDIAAKGINFVKDLCAIAPQCTAGLIVTLNQLNAVAGLKAGSSEIKALPDWPKTLPVYAFAGNITPHYNLFGWEFNGFPSNSDTLVTVPSALHEVKANGLGGSETFTCVGRPAPVLPNWTKADCEHAALLNNAALRAGVVKAIGGYVAKKMVKPSVSPSGTEVRFKNMRLTLPSNWTAEYEESNLLLYRNKPSCAYKNPHDCPLVAVTGIIAGDPGECGYGPDSDKPAFHGNFAIGSKNANYTVVYVCKNTRDSDAHTWELPKSDIKIWAEDAVVLPELRQILANARWQ